MSEISENPRELQEERGRAQKKIEFREQLTKAILNKNIPVIKLEADENGNAIVDKELHPEIYDWVKNG